MTKRYAYWRKPDGTYHKGSDDKHAPTELLQEIGKSARVNPEGGVSFQLISLMRPLLSVASRIVIIDPSDNELNGDHTQSLTSQALDSVILKQGGGKPVTATALLQAINTKAADHFRQPVADYVLVTSLSVKKLPISWVKIGDCKIFGLARRANKFPFPESLQGPLGDSLLTQHVQATEYCPVRIKTNGRTTNEAVDKALDALNYLRGVWTLFASYGKVTLRFGAPRRDPIGVIHSGPVHTLHHPDGTLVNDGYWYDSDYVEDQRLFVPKNGWERIEQNRRWAFKNIKKLPYRDDLVAILARYAVALDHSNLDLAFLQVWSILEKITDTIGGPYDKTIDRTIWMFTDRQVAKERLEHLRLRRNQYVHSARSSSGRQEDSYMVKSFVDPHLLSLIRNDFGVDSLEEYGEFLSLPTTVSVLKARRQMLDTAINIQDMKKKADANASE